MRRLFLLLPLALAASFAAPAARADVTSPAPSFMPVATPLVQGRVPTRGMVRVDLMMHSAGDQTLSIGVGRQHGVQGVHPTGTW
jgi:hypothetical protein